MRTVHSLHVITEYVHKIQLPYITKVNTHFIGNNNFLHTYVVLELAAAQYCYY